MRPYFKLSQCGVKTYQGHNAMVSQLIGAGFTIVLDADGIMTARL